ncbi:hypothetical protein GR927_36620, partial [Mycolicibacterium sp. 3033]|nr:hypothetical protein [Mycolicibacterium aurantiacum]
MGQTVVIHPYRPLPGLWVELPRRSHNHILLVRSRSPPDPGRFINNYHHPERYLIPDEGAGNDDGRADSEDEDVP